MKLLLFFVLVCGTAIAKPMEEVDNVQETSKSFNIKNETTNGHRVERNNDQTSSKTEDKEPTIDNNAVDEKSR